MPVFFLSLQPSQKSLGTRASKARGSLTGRRSARSLPGDHQPMYCIPAAGSLWLLRLVSGLLTWKAPFPTGFSPLTLSPVLPTARRTGLGIGLKTASGWSRRGSPAMCSSWGFPASARQEISSGHLKPYLPTFPEILKGPERRPWDSSAQESLLPFEPVSRVELSDPF